MLLEKGVWALVLHAVLARGSLGSEQMNALPMAQKSVLPVLPIPLLPSPHPLLLSCPLLPPHPLLLPSPLLPSVWSLRSMLFLFLPVLSCQPRRAWRARVEGCTSSDNTPHTSASFSAWVRAQGQEAWASGMACSPSAPMRRVEPAFHTWPAGTVTEPEQVRWSWAS